MLSGGAGGEVQCSVDTDGPAPGESQDPEKFPRGEEVGHSV